MTTQNTTAFEILVGARALYASNPHNGALVDVTDGKTSHCALGALGAAKGLSTEELENAEDEYAERLSDNNGLDEAAKLLAFAAMDQASLKCFEDLLDEEWDEVDKIAGFDGADLGDISEDDARPFHIAARDRRKLELAEDKNGLWEYIYGLNDNTTKRDPETNKFVPSAEVLLAFDDAIKAASGVRAD